MTTPIATPFIFTTCQVGAEQALKAELARLRPEWKFAYSRPGFVTFKLPEGERLKPGFDLDSIFARAFGLSVGKAKGASFEERVEAVKQAKAEHKAQTVHVWGRERQDGRDAKRDKPLEPADLVEQARAAMASFSGDVTRVKKGGLVLDVVIVESGEWWLGLHEQNENHRPWVGGVFTRELPAEAPSRAYLKLEEGVEWAQFPLKAGQRALEFGAAPGGAAYALLQRGLSVVGVDPGEMAASILCDYRFVQLRRQALQVTPEEVKGVDWVFSDMNLPPDDVFKVFKKLMPAWRGTIKGGLVTLKLSNWEAADSLGGLVDKFCSLGFKHARVGHLTNNRQEVCLALSVD